MEHRRSLSARAPSILLMSAWIAFPALVRADEGVIELSHARALAGGVSSIDGPGYPIDLNQSGSYRLTSDLVSPTASTTVLRLIANGIRIDLNGFSIRGVTVCTPGAQGVTCVPNNGTNPLVSASLAHDVTLENGTIRNGGSLGADLGNRAVVRNVRFVSNRLDGLRTGLFASVTDCTSAENGGEGFEIGSSSRIAGAVAMANGGDGIEASTASTVLDSTANGNFGWGIDGDQLTVSRNTVNGNREGGIIVTSQGTIVDDSVMGNAGHGIACLGQSTRGCTVADNTVNGNASFGLLFNGASGYRGNTVNGNGSTVSNGVQTGGNVCDGDAVCP